jgi:hypothetical protein
LRTTSFEQGDLVWQAEAAEQLKQQGLDFASICKRLMAKPVVECMPVV